MKQQNDSDILGTLLEQLIEQSKLGNQPSLEALCEEYPTYAEQLRELYSTVCMIEQIKPAADLQTSASDSSERTNARLGDYQILREVARGGMGIVYEAIQLSLGRHVALKVISQHLLGKHSGVMRFRREARAAAQLHHTNIVPVFDVGKEENTYFYSMQYIPGQGLDQVIEELRQLKRAGNSTSKALLFQAVSPLALASEAMHVVPFALSEESKSLTERTSPGSSMDPCLDGRSESSFPTTGTHCSLFHHNVARIGIQVADALAYAHARGIIHRDIKPSNILIDLGGTAWVTDFGLAKAGDESEDSQEEDLTGTGDILGTLRYLAPERLRGQHDHRGDLYGLGATLYELLVGRPIFEEPDRIHLMAMISHKEPTRLRKWDATIPQDLETIIHKCLSKEPSQRYRNAQALVDDLRLFLLDRPIQSRRASWIEQWIRWCRRNRAAAILGLIILSLIGIVAIGGVLNQTLQRQRDEAIVLLKRTESAEKETQTRALLNSVAAYRLTLGPDLHAHRQKLEAVSTELLSEALQRDLRNELAACLSRADWYHDDLIAAAGTEYCIDRSGSWIAESRENQDVEIRARPGSEALGNSPLEQAVLVTKDLGLAPQNLSFSRSSKFLVASDNEGHFQIIRRSTSRTIHQGPQWVAGLDVCDEAETAVYWYDQAKITIESLSNATPGQGILSASLAGPATSCRLHPSGSHVAIAMASEVLLLEVPSGKEIRRWACDQPGMMEWSPDGRWLAIADAQNAIRVWDVWNRELVAVLGEQNSYIASLDWDPTSQYVACQTWDGTLQVINVWSGRTMVRSKKSLSKCLFSHDGSYLGWDIEKGGMRRVRWEPGLVRDLPFNSRMGNSSATQCASDPSSHYFVAAANDHVEFFDWENNAYLGQLPISHTIAVEFARDGTELVFLCRNCIQRWPVETKRSESTFTVIGPPTIIPCLPISSGFLRLESDTAAVTTSDPSPQLAELDLKTGSIGQILRPSLSMAVKRLGTDGMCALHGWLSTSIALVDFDRRLTLQELPVAINSQVFRSLASNRLFTTDRSEIGVWEGPEWRRLGKVPYEAPLVGATIAYSPNGEQMIAPLAPNYLAMLDSKSLEVRMKLESNFLDSYNWMEYSPDGRHLLATCLATHVLKVWDLENLKESLSKPGGADGPGSPTRERRLAPSRLVFERGDLDDRVRPGNDRLLAFAQHAYAQNPSAPNRQNNYAWQALLDQTGSLDLEEMEGLARNAFLGVPDSTTYANTLAYACYRNRKWEEARTLLLKNLARNSGTQLTYDLILLALVEGSSNNRESADYFYEWAIRNRLEGPAKSTMERRELDLFFEEYQALLQANAKE